MKLVERYIFVRALKIVVAALAVALAMAWVTQVLARVDLVTDSGQSVAKFLELATLLLPSVIPVVIPFAVVIGITQTLTTMNQDSELAVIAAAGAPRTSIWRPMLLLAVLASALAFIIDNTIEPAARQRVRQIVATAHADLLSSVIQEGSFRKIDDGLFVQVGERLPDGRLGRIFVADSRQKDVDLIYYAKQGEVRGIGKEQVLFMADGEVHRKAPGGDVSIIRFTSYAFDLSEFAPKAEKAKLYPKDQTLAYLLDPDPNDHILKWSPPFFYAELHRRFTEWSYAIVFALIALAAAADARSHRQARIHPMVTAIAIAIIVRWEGYFIANKAQNSAAMVPFVYAVPIVNAAIAIYFLVSNRVLEPPASWSNRASDLFEAMVRRWRTLRRRYRPAGADGRR